MLCVVNIIGVLLGGEVEASDAHVIRQQQDWGVPWNGPPDRQPACYKESILRTNMLPETDL